jgi:predicted kinase
MYGLPAADKTTRARELERELAALRLTLDEWMVPLFPTLSFGDPEYAEHVKHLQELLWDVAAQALTAGVDVILDWNFWSVTRRRWAVQHASDVGADVVVHCLPMDVDRAVEQARRRNEQQAGAFHRLTRTDVEHLVDLMAPPDPSEGLTVRTV